MSSPKNTLEFNKFTNKFAYKPKEIHTNVQKNEPINREIDLNAMISLFASTLCQRATWAELQNWPSGPARDD